MWSFATVAPLPPIAGTVPDGFCPIVALVDSCAFCHIRGVGTVVALSVGENVVCVEFLDGEFVCVEEAAGFLTDILPIRKPHGIIR